MWRFLKEKETHVCADGRCQIILKSTTKLWHLFRISCFASSLDQREKERRERVREQALPRRTVRCEPSVYPYYLVSLTFRVSLFSSTRQDVPFTRVIKGGNRNDRLTSRVNVTVVTAHSKARSNHPQLTSPLLTKGEK